MWSRQQDAYSVAQMGNLFTIETIQSEALRVFISKKQKNTKKLDQEMKRKKDEIEMMNLRLQKGNDDRVTKDSQKFCILKPTTGLSLFYR